MCRTLEAAVLGFYRISSHWLLQRHTNATQMPHIPRAGERLPSLDEVRDTSEHPERGGEGPASRKETPHWVELSEKGQAFMLLGEMQEFSAVVQHGVTDISNQKRMKRQINQCGVWKFTFQKRLGGCESRTRGTCSRRRRNFEFIVA